MAGTRLSFFYGPEMIRETRSYSRRLLLEMEQVMDSARRVNQVMTKGNYGTQAARYWAALRTNINDLARCYNLTPMGT